MRGALQPTGSSDLDARLGLGRTRYDSATTRNVSGLFGSLAWTWRPTGRLRLQTRWSRDPSQDSYFLDNFFSRGTLSYDRVATTLQVRADLALSGKTDQLRIGDAVPEAMQKAAGVVELEQGGERMGRLFILPAPSPA